MDPRLLRFHDARGVLTDGQMAASDGDFWHVMDEHWRRSQLAGLVELLLVGQTVPPQRAQLASAPAHFGLQLDDARASASAVSSSSLRLAGSRSWSRTTCGRARPLSA